MGFLNTDSMPRLVEKLADGDNIKITGNSKGNRVGTVIKKIVEKADDVTKAIEQEVVNDSYSFKVGTGDVDVSADVEDGFGEVGIKGVTYQNLVNGAYPKQGSFSNLENNKTRRFIFSTTNLLKPNTKYTIAFSVDSLVLDDANSIELRVECTKFSLNGVRIGYVDKIGRYIFSFSTNDLSLSSTSTTVVLKGVNNQWENSDTTTRSITISNIVLLEGDHTNNPNLPSYFEGIVGVGDKSKNLFNGKNVSIGYLTATGAINASGTTCRVTDYIEVKSNTSYTVNNPASETHCFYDSNKNFISYVGARTFITPINCKYVRCTIKRADYDNTFQLEEGSTATPYEPYYDGHKIEILSRGKNLFDTNFLARDSSYMSNIFPNQFDFQGWATRNMSNLNVKKMLKPNTTYTFSFKVKMLQKVGTVQLYQYDVGMMFYHAETNPSSFGVCKTNSITQVGHEKEIKATFTTPNNLDKYELRIYSNRYSEGNVVQYDIIRFYDIQLEEQLQTSFEPYVEDKTQILLDEPLMRLPNGVCDEITRDGKLIRRIGKIILDGNNYNIVPHSISSEITPTKYRWKIYGDSSFSNNGGFVHCNNYPSVTPVETWTASKEGVTQNSSSNTIYLYLEKYSDGSQSSREALIKQFQDNPTTIYYELSTPVITELPAPYLRIFKDGHLTFNTLVAPESNHVVQLNKSAQIERSIREVQGLDSRVGQLESFYDDMMLETSHKLNLLNYDFEYTKERNGE